MLPKVISGRRGLPRLLRWLAALVLLLPGGCLPPNAQYEFGLGTDRVTGTITLERPEEASGGPIVVVLKHHHSFVGFEGQGAITLPTAHVPPVEQDGTFRVRMPADVVAMEIYIAAPGHVTDTFQFKRQIGVGDIHYTANLRFTPGWRSHYYTYLNPQFEHFIVEERYRLAPHEQDWLSRWLVEQNARFDR